DSAGVIYTGTAVTDKTLRVLGYLEYTLATAGTWDTPPSLIKLWSQGDKLPGDRVQIQQKVDAVARSVVGATPTNSGAFVSITPSSEVNAIDFSVSAVVGNSTTGESRISLYRGAVSLVPVGASHSGSSTLDSAAYIYTTVARVLDFPGSNISI